MKINVIEEINQQQNIFIKNYSDTEEYNNLDKDFSYLLSNKKIHHI